MNGSRRALGIGWAQPQRALTITGLGQAHHDDPWPTIRRQVNRVAELAKRLGSPLGEVVWHVERNPNGTGFHAHLWQHGPKVDTDVFREACERAGAGRWNHVSVIRHTGSVGQYGLKGLGYGMKSLDGAAADYLNINGGRLTHQTRHFFRGLGVRQAEVQALKNHEWTSPWILSNRSA